MPNLLSIENLKICIHNETELNELIKGVHLKIEELQIVALVGASGSGKTTIGFSILNLLPASMIMTGGKIMFKGEDITNYSPPRMQRLRGKEIAMVFQEPLSAFNPVFTIGYQIEEVLKIHTKLNGRQRKERILELLNIVGIAEPKRIAGQYPHQLSGGMRQRAMIAQAVSVNPQLIIADEPTSNLDVTLQAHIIELFRKLNKDFKISFLLITHDLGVVRQLADQTAVLYDGRIVEAGPTQEMLAATKHPFTSELIHAAMD